MESEKKRAANSVIWSAIERFSVQGVQFILGIIIARLLLPTDYGLIAMLAIFMAIAQTFVDSGFSNALIQKNNRTEVDYSTVFYFNLVISLVLYILLYVSAPAIADFYQEDQLVVLTRYLGLNIIISGLTVVHRAKLTILLDFKTQAKASLIAVCISGGIGLALAYYGFGVWALVIQNILNNLLNVAFLYFYAKWKPLFIFSWNSFKELFSFGSKLLLSGLMHTIYTNMYSLVIGKLYNAADVGYYNRANTFSQFLSSNAMGIITRVVYPLQCRIQDDNEKLAVSFSYYLRLSCFITIPLTILIGVLAKPLILVLLTEKWLFVAPLLSILCIANVWCPVMSLNNSMLNVKGRSDYFLKAEIIKKALSLVILIITIPLGVKVLCWGVLVYNIIDCIIIIYFSKKVIKTTYISQFKVVLPILLLSLSMAVVVYFVMIFLQSSVAQLLIGGVVGFFYIIIIGKLFKFAEILFVEKWIRLKLIKK